MEDDDPFCYYCHKDCKSSARLHDHLRRVHPGTNAQLSLAPLPSDKTFADIWATGRRLVVAGSRSQVFHYPRHPDARVGGPVSVCGKAVSWTLDPPYRLCGQCDRRATNDVLSMLSENPF